MTGSVRGHAGAGAEAPPGRLPYLPALDGLRALALVFVLAFHADVPAVRGGYLPLTAFFVLSGFLITALLLLERDRTGRVDLRAFWGRRVRRLGPAALMGLWLVVAYAAWGARGAIEGLTADVVSALTWSTNWRLIFSGQEYAAAFADPSPLQHYWSLAVEEQFYVVLPLLVGGLLLLGRGRRRWLVVGVVVLAAGSVALTAWVHTPGDAPLRAYFGTDTRAAELLVGVLLACAMIGSNGLRSFAGWARRLVDVGGVLALGVSVWLWFVISPYDDRLYEGGLLGFAILAAVVVTAASQRGTVVERLLGARPVAWFGRISYGAYLFHWPIFLWVDEDLTGLSTWPLFALRMAITVPLAAGSFRFVESPLRSRRWTLAPATSAWLNASVAVTAVTVVVVAGLPINAVTLRVEDRVAASAEEPISPGSTSVAAAPLPPPGAADVTPSVPAPAPAPLRPLRVMVVGDSIAFNLVTGLLRYQEDGGPVVVQDSSIPACTLTRGGIRQIQVGPWPIEPWCEWWDGDEPAARMAAFRPDVVLVNTTVNEIFDRQRDAWGDQLFRSPGDPLFDRFIVDEWSAVVDVFGADGVPVAWVTPVCTDFASFMPGYIESGEGDRRVDYFREELFPRLVATRPIGVVDLNAELCPGDEFTPDVYGMEGGRSDGFHVTDEVAERIARRFLVPRLNELVRVRAILDGTA